MPGKHHAGAQIAAALLVIAGITGLCFVVFFRLKTNWNWESFATHGPQIFQGWLITIAISTGALIASCLLGILLLLGQRSGLRALEWFCRGYVELIRGTPLLVQLMVGYYLVSDAFGLTSKIWIGILLLASFTGAYIGEILRGGIESIDRAQIDSARAVGFDRFQVYRHVVFPQAIRRVMPALAGQFVSLVKDSSLLSVIGIGELTQEIRIANAATYSTFEGFLPLALGYLVLTIPISLLARLLERRMKYES